jgi:hypothetical protein
MGQFGDACPKFEDIMQEKPDHASGEVTVVVNIHFLTKAVSLLPVDQFMVAQVDFFQLLLIHVWLVKTFYIVLHLLVLFFFATFLHVLFCVLFPCLCYLLRKEINALVC